jgi:hypothetical protein
MPKEVAKSTKQPSERLGHQWCFLGDLAPREAEDLIAARLQARVAGAVLFEGGTGSVGFPAVQLDDEPLLSPEEVDEITVEVDVRLGAREAVAPAETEEPGLQLAARVVGRDSVAGWEAEVLGLAERDREQLARKDAAQVLERSGWARPPGYRLDGSPRPGKACGIDADGFPGGAFGRQTSGP